jgi:Tfp pilus assembly major pilin PilA
MKRALTILFAAALGLNGCSSDPVKQEAKSKERSAENAVSQAPEWMTKLPKDPGMIYENGTATSTDFSTADIKARNFAYSKICVAAGGKVRSQTSTVVVDNGDVAVDKSEIAIKSICPDVDVSGVQTINTKHVAEGPKIRTYILVGLPLAGKNIIRSNREANERADKALKDLDVTVDNMKKSEQAAKSP